MPASQSLLLITGPPNTGKAGEVVRRLGEVIDDSPVLVVPTADDVDRFQRELVARFAPAAVLNTPVVTFYGLIGSLISTLGTEVGRRAQAPVQLAAVRRAIRETKLLDVERSANTPGFGPALLQAIHELWNENRDPVTAMANVEDAGGDWRALDIANLFGSYVELLTEIGMEDIYMITERVLKDLRARPEKWHRRPVFFYGFDDFSPLQLEVVSALARAADVVVTAIWEDREANLARASLVTDLVDGLGANWDNRDSDPVSHEGETAALGQLARNFLEPDVPELEDASGITALIADGDRAQVELVASAVARLIAAGVEPGSIEVVLRNPDRDGPAWIRQFRRLDIPAATTAVVDPHRTAAGTAMAALVRLLGPRGGEADLITWLRLGVGAGYADDVDRIEAEMRRRRNTESGPAVRARARGLVPEVDLGDGPANVLRRLAEIAGGLPQGTGSAAAEAVEAAASTRIAEALSELAQLAERGFLGDADVLAEATATMATITVPLSTGSAEDRVRITSPQSLRANRSDYLFVCSLQDGEFPRHDRPRKSLIGEEDRKFFKLDELVDPAAEDAYLFATCLAHPRRGLYLCWQEVGGDGSERMRSHFIDEVLAQVPGGLDGIPVHRRPLADVVFPIAVAPTRREVKRLLAARGAGSQVSPETAAPLAADVKAARAYSDFEPPETVTGPAAEQLATRSDFRVTEIEKFVSCPWCWFIDHEIKPAMFSPEANPLIVGTIVHRALERLYLDPPGSGHDTIPRAETVGEWVVKAREIVAECAETEKVGGDGHELVAIRARAAALVIAWIEHEATLDTGIRPERDLLEASFGGDSEMAPFMPDPDDLPGVTLRGKIDRADKLPGSGAVLLRDYKSGSKVANHKKFADESVIQPQVYAMAMEETFGREVAAAMLVPLGGLRNGGKERGAVKEDEAEQVAEIGIVKNDIVDEVEWATVMDDARAAVSRAVSMIRAGGLPMQADALGVGGACGRGAVCSRDREWLPEEDTEDET